MSILRITDYPNSGVLYLYSDRELIQLDPTYQRSSDIWSLDKRQLLIDSIINGYDIPKFYFHRFSKPKDIDGETYSYAIIDGKQRLSSIWGFINGEFPLGPGAQSLEDESQEIAGLTYSELGKEFPRLKMRFDVYALSVKCVETDDLELIEDMFSRLNEAVPLSAAEKRNAFGGETAAAIRSLSKHNFFGKALPFGNKRYRHFDLAAKFLHIEASGKIVDSKKAYLDKFAREWATGHTSGIRAAKTAAKKVLDEMGRCFTKPDPLLRSVGMVSLYYHLFRLATRDGWCDKVSRTRLKKFDVERELNRTVAAGELGDADYDLLEFDRYTQSPNDGYAMTIRLRILLDHVFSIGLDEDYGAGSSRSKTSTTGRAKKKKKKK
jgi:hypothetical protein